MAFLRFLADLRNPVCDSLFSVITLLGEETFFILIGLLFFWCINKKEGYYLLTVGLFGTVLNQFLKLLFRIPRPWVRDPDFTIVESAREGASGYSFPSGHTQNVVGTLGGLARWHKQLWLRLASIAILVLCAFSRMYLGVHTPADVGVSLLIAAVLVFVLYPIVRRAADSPRRMYLLLGVMTAISFAFVLYANLWQFPGDISAENLYSGRKNSYSLFGALLGFCVGYAVEHKYIRFEVKAVWWAQILKVLGGLALILAFKEGLKLIFNAIGFTWLGTNAIRYFVVVILASIVWPLTFPWLSSLGRKGKKA